MPNGPRHWVERIDLPDVRPLDSDTGAVWALNPDPWTLSSLDFQ